MYQLISSWCTTELEEQLKPRHINKPTPASVTSRGLNAISPSLLHEERKRGKYVMGYDETGRDGMGQKETGRVGMGCYKFTLAETTTLAKTQPRTLYLWISRNVLSQSLV